jgi:hypothetical protein
MDLLKASPETVAATLGALSYNEVISDRTAEGMMYPDHNYVVAYRVDDGVYFVERCMKGEYTYGAMGQEDIDNLHWYLVGGLSIMDILDAVNLTGELPPLLPLDYVGRVNAIVLKSSEGHDHPENQWYEWVMVDNPGRMGGKIRACWESVHLAVEWTKEYGTEDACNYHLVPEHSFIRAPIMHGTLHKLPEVK